MPSARELLEQADALMRRNRARAVNTEIPELTEAVPAIVRPTPKALDEVPELTDIVEEIEIESIADMPDDAEEPSAWMGFDQGEPSVVGEPADSVGALPPPPIEPAPVPPAAANPAPVDDWARWQAIADEIRMQVLQRIDIFTDTGLRDQLGMELQPIVERASAEMVATINEQVGKLLRAYIAEAIEREIEKWRKGNS